MAQRILLAGLLTTAVALVVSCAGQGEEVGSTPSKDALDEATATNEVIEFDDEYLQLLISDGSNQTPFGFESLDSVHDLSVLSEETDEYGAYKRVRVSLKQEYIDAIPLVYSRWRDFDELYDEEGNPLEGVTDFDKDGGGPIEDIPEGDMREAIRVFSDFVLNETLDSIALDNPDRYPEWLETVGATTMTPRFLNDLRLAYDPYGLSEDALASLEDDPFWAYMVANYGPPEGSNLHYSTATPGLYYQGAVDTTVVLPEDFSTLGLPGHEDPDTTFNVSWGAVNVPMIRDAESRTSNKHIYAMSFLPRGTGAIPSVEIRARAFVRYTWENQVVWDREVLIGYDKGDADFSADPYRSQEIDLLLSYSLVKEGDSWLISEGGVLDTSGYYPPDSQQVSSGDIMNDLRYLDVGVD